MNDKVLQYLYLLYSFNFEHTSVFVHSPVFAPNPGRWESKNAVDIKINWILRWWPCSGIQRAQKLLKIPKRKRSAIFLNGSREVIVSQTNIETVSKATLRDGVERKWVFLSAYIPS